MFYQWQQHDPDKGPRVARTRTGCWTCRRRKVRCDEEHPKCGHCSRLHLSCSWPSTVVAPNLRRTNGKSMSKKQQEQQYLANSNASADSSKAALGETPRTWPDQTANSGFDEVFSYASFMWDAPSPTFSTGWHSGFSNPSTGPLSFDESYLSTPLILDVPNGTYSSKTSIVGESTPSSTVFQSFIASDESQLASYFAQSKAPPILALETTSRWSWMRKTLMSMSTKSSMVKQAIMTFAAFQMESSSQSSKPHQYLRYYASSKEQLKEILGTIRQDQMVLGVEMKHLLAVMFLLTYIDLLAEDVSEAHANLRESFATLQLVNTDSLGVTEKCLLSWLRLLDGRAVSAGGEGLFLNEDDNTLHRDLQTQDEITGEFHRDPNDAEVALEDVLTRPAIHFFQKVQSFMGRISKIDPWHRSRGTVENETEVMLIAAQIGKDIRALWRQRPPHMDQAIARRLVPPLLSPSLSDTVTRILMVCYANYNASFIHLHRVAYKNLPRTADVKNAITAIREVTRLLTEISPQSNSFSNDGPSSPMPDTKPHLPVNMLWPLLMLGVETDDAEQRTWIISTMKDMENTASNAKITAAVLQEVIRRQDETGQRIDVRQVMHDTFTHPFAIV